MITYLCDFLLKKILISINLQQLRQDAVELNGKIDKLTVQLELSNAAKENQEKEILKLKAEHEKSQRDLEAEAVNKYNSLSDAAKENLEKEILKLKTEYEKIQRDLEADALKKYNELSDAAKSNLEKEIHKLKEEHDKNQRDLEGDALKKYNSLLGNPKMVYAFII